MRVLFVALLFSVVLSGCMFGPWTETEEGLVIDIQADGPYRVGVPVPVHEQGGGFDDWFEVHRVSGDATTETWSTAEGQLVVVEGDGHATIRAQLRLDGDVESYLDAEWSGGQTNESHHRAGIWRGSVTVTIDYVADSEYCSRSDHYEGAGAAETPRGDDQPPRFFDLVGEREAICT